MAHQTERPKRIPGPIPGVTFRESNRGGDMDTMVRTKEWSRTPLGPMDQWSPCLKRYMDMVLELPTPAIIFWAPELVEIYNSGYAEVMGPRHPEHFGSTYGECWPDTYPLIFPWMQRVLQNGEIVEVQDSMIAVTRYGFTEEAYFSFTFSPLREQNGDIEGILQIVTERTAAVLAERRRRALQAVSLISGSACATFHFTLPTEAAEPTPLVA